MVAIKKTTQWLEQTIIGMNFCPFARFPYEKGLIRLSESKETSDQARLDFFIDEIALLELNLKTDLSTTLIIYSECKESFIDFNDFCGMCENFLIEAHLDSDFQVVVFHPEFHFQNELPSDPTNMVGQSHYPTLHILRNADIDQAMANYPDVGFIPERNRQKILALNSKK